MASTLPLQDVAIPGPFAYNAGSRNSIAATADQTSSAEASWQYGFPPLTAQPITEGGIPPGRLDMNGLGYYATWPLWLLQQGAQFTFSENVSNTIGGYPLGAILYYYDANSGECKLLRSTKANNTDNFVTTPSYIGTSWIDVSPRPTMIGVPVGTIIASLSGLKANADTTGFLLCNGAYVSKTDYAALFNVIGTTFGQSGNNFALPNLQNRFLQGATSSGTTRKGAFIAPGIPNITGTFTGAGVQGSATAASIATGAFYIKKKNGGARVENVDAEKDDLFGFDASKSSAVYGASNTVQPPAFCVDFWIRY